MKIPVNAMSLEGYEKRADEAMNPFTREPSQHFKEALGGKSLAYVFLRRACSREPFRKQFSLEMQKDATLVYDEMIENIYKARVLATEERNAITEKWAKFLERPRNKWGDSPLEKALGNIFKPFLFVT